MYPPRLPLRVRFGRSRFLHSAPQCRAHRLLTVCEGTLLKIGLLVHGLQASQPFELRDGDREVWLGGTFVERAQQYGYMELALTTR